MADTEDEIGHDFMLPLSDAAFDVVAIGSSLGGLNALRQVLSSLPPDFPAAIVIAQHLSPRFKSTLPELLASHTPLPVRWATDGEQMQPATVYLAPPDHHVWVNPEGTLSTSRDGKVQFARPSATLLFESVAWSCRGRGIVVVLTGLGSDGAEGVRAVKRMGGVALTQDRATSRAFAMPSAAIETGCVDFTLPVNRIASALITLVMARGAAVLFRVPHSPPADEPRKEARPAPLPAPEAQSVSL